MISIKLCVEEYCLLYPYVILLFIPLLILLIILIKRTFVKFLDGSEKSEFAKKNKTKRIWMTISRAIILLLVLIAVASPVTLKEKTSKGDFSLTILADSSTSFDIFEKNIPQTLKSKIDDEIPTTIRYIATGNNSNIGDELLNNIQGNDNILLISDGYSTKGKSLGDMMFFASYLNTTISTLDLEPKETDYWVVIDAPREVTLGNEFTYYVDVYNVGEKQNYNIKIKVDESVIIDETATGSKSYELSEYLREGYHNITATIKLDDFFPQNNVFYKTIRVLPKPRILYIAPGQRRFEDLLQRLYLPDIKYVLPHNLDEYSTVIIDDIPAAELNSRFDTLSEYISDGNGLVIIGGKDAYDNGGYDNSLFETLLPVKIGVPGQDQEGDVNIVIVIDISGTTTFDTSATSGVSKLSVQKAQAIEILKSLPPEYNVGVVAFDNFGYYITKKVLPLGDQPGLNNTIARIQSDPRAGTEIGAGLQKAFYLLEGLPGSNNVILISDGITQHPERAIGNVNRMATLGIKTYTVGIGEDTNREFMQALALDGNGIYFEPDETQKLSLIFNGTEETKSQKNSLVILNAYHFITDKLPLRASVSGFNQVVPKPSARLLVSSYSSNPILTIWRFGLGRVASLTTNPEYWSDDMLSGENSQLLTRTINWAIGDPSRNKQFDVKVRDVNLGETAEIGVISKKPFTSTILSFSKVGESYYKANYIAATTGFKKFFGTQMAVNYPFEYQNLGLNPELRDLVSITGGQIFSLNETDELIDFIKSKSKRKTTETVYFRWPFLLAALFLFLIEICIRRIKENRNIYKAK